MSSKKLCRQIRFGYCFDVFTVMCIIIYFLVHTLSVLWCPHTNHVRFVLTHLFYMRFMLYLCYL